uniref:Insc_C domain-containing protein n=1 Tax=Syphacia muris TaxID=451379 RepID=A0A0N5AKA8_9BILA
MLMLGEDLRLAAIYTLCQSSATPTDTLRLLLRALAVLCNTTAGTQQLISLGGLDLIKRILCFSSIACGVEAAGVLTQLTSPNRSLIKLSTSIDIITARLLDIIDECSSGESLLLCVAALANLSMQSHSVASVLYQHNAVKRLIAALSRPKCSTMFVQEQVVTVFSRMATQDYEEVLIAQGAIPVLFSMLSIYDPVFAEYSRRIQYKAALCLGTISSKGVGLKAVHQNNGYSIISKTLQMQNTAKTPVEQICRTIKEKLEAKYELESAV